MLLEIVPGIDNIVFISILVDRLPPEQRKKGRITAFSLGVEILNLKLRSKPMKPSADHPVA